MRQPSGKLTKLWPQTLSYTIKTAFHVVWDFTMKLNHINVPKERYIDLPLLNFLGISRRGALCASWV